MEEQVKRIEEFLKDTKKNIIARLHKQQLLPSGLDEEGLFVEYCRFLSMRLERSKSGKVDKVEDIVPSPLIDLLWHEHILNTKDYGSFQSQFGSLDHDPNTIFESEELKLRKKKLTREFYIQSFGSSPPSLIWDEEEKEEKKKEEPKKDGSFQVKTLSGTIYDIEMNEKLTVGKLKELLLELSQVSTDHQRIIFGGKLLTDEQVLSEIGVVEGSIVHLVLKLC
eukprot:TRINITY_DN987_c0_g1_i1.p1 TRINITY_DN987_c0_g1~~TRINITY_DN987_c0_g1_i1.p1  ORF type:complete len:223 (-),score=93.66 TRINITY_DN987_c0_g1_i1:71-739(-)